MAFDFKKEYREFYLPKDAPELVTIPRMNYVAVRGEGDPNQPGGAYQQAMGILYGVAFTLKMSPKAGHEIAGFFQYVVPPLEGFWWQEGREGIDPRDKAAFRWISVIRLPDFIGPSDFAWAVETATRKKKQDFSPAEFLTLEEGLCVQMMHHGPFDTEAASLARIYPGAGVRKRPGRRATPPRDIPLRRPEGPPGAVEDGAAAPCSFGLKGVLGDG